MIYLRFSSSVGLIPLGHKLVEVPEVVIEDKFTAVISVTSDLVTSSAPVFSLLSVLSACPDLRSIVILWRSEVKPPPIKDWKFLGRLSDSVSLKIQPTNATSR